MIQYESNSLIIFSSYEKYNDWEFIKSLFSSIPFSENEIVFLISVGGEYLPPNTSLTHDECAIIKNEQIKANNSNKKIIVVLESILEAPTYKYNLGTIIYKLSRMLDIPESDFIILGGALHQFDSPVKNAVSYMIFGNHITSENEIVDTIPTTHFLSLSRLAKHHRILGTIEILERNLKNYGMISLGSGYYNEPAENYYGDVPEKYKNVFPLHVDGTITKGPTNLLQYGTSNGLFLKAFSNVVFETSYEYDVIGRSGWNVPFLTEKSAKPFSWGQVPIFVTYQHTINYIRELGFDMFDDIIDHSYDSEYDSYLRIKLAINQLEKICNRSLEYWQSYKKENIIRFESNKNIMKELTLNKKIELTLENLKKALNKT